MSSISHTRCQVTESASFLPNVILHQGFGSTPEITDAAHYSMYMRLMRAFGILSLRSIPRNEELAERHVAQAVYIYSDLFYLVIQVFREITTAIVDNVNLIE